MSYSRQGKGGIDAEHQTFLVSISFWAPLSPSTLPAMTEIKYIKRIRALNI